MWNANASSEAYGYTLPIHSTFFSVTSTRTMHCSFDAENSVCVCVCVFQIQIMFKKERGTRANEQIQQALLEIGSICTSLVVFYNDNNKTLKQP